MHRVQRVPGDRVAGPHPHLRRRRARAARGRGRRGRDRPERPAHRRLPLVRARRAERQHHRLRGAHHAPARPASSSPARTRRASCRTRSRRCASCAPGCWPPPRRRPTQEASDARRSQVRTVDRSERVRTYNFPENRIADHRVGFKAYNLDQVLDGDLDAGHPGAASTPTPRPGWPTARPVTAADDRAAAPRWPQATARLAAAGVPVAALRRRGARRVRARRRARRAAPRRRTRTSTRATGRPSPAARPASRCSTSPAAPTSATWSSRSARASSCRGRRPRSVAGWAIDAVRRDGRRRAAGRRPGHRLRRHRAGHRQRGAALAACTPSSSTRGAHAWAARNVEGSGASTCTTATAPTRCPSWTAGRPGDQQPAVHPARPSGSPSTPRRRDHDPALALWSGERRPRRDPRGRADRRAGCCGPAAGRRRARRPPGRPGAVGLRRGPAAGRRRATTRTWPAGTASSPRPARPPRRRRSRTRMRA